LIENKNMQNLENETIEQQIPSEQKESSTTQNILDSADPVQVIELVVEAGKFVLDTSKDVVSSITDHIDINF
jgi:hypothetical protein